MTFEWVKFLRQHHIPYVEEGPSIVRGNVAIHCPFCGGADPSQHMGLLVDGPKRGRWGCWRNSAHRGNKPHNLIMALLGCSYSQAATLVGDKGPTDMGDDKDVSAHLKQLFAEPEEGSSVIEPLDWPANIRRLDRPSAYADQFIRYLTAKRGYTKDEAWVLARVYSLRYAVRGPFAYRLIIPVRMKEGLVGWTGRTILTEEKLRYMSLTDKAQKAKELGLVAAPMNIKSTLWNYRNLLKNTQLEFPHEVLVVVEGPLDALRVDYFGRPYGVRATCLFSKSLSVAQEALLGTLADRFTHKLILVDADAQTDAFPLWTRLERYGFQYHLLAEGDPAEMSADQIKGLRRVAARV